MNPSPDIVKKTAIVLIVMVVVGIVGYVLKSQTSRGPTPANVSLIEKVQKKHVVRKIKLTDVAPPQKRYVNDQDVMRAIIACKRQNLSLADCVRVQNQKYEVMAAVPDRIANDGFEGFIMFPISTDSQIIMDYNRLLTRQQFVYYGSFADLQDQVDSGGFHGNVAARVKSVENIVK